LAGHGAFTKKAIDLNCLRRFVIRFAITKTSSRAGGIWPFCVRSLVAAMGYS